jgi:plasmid maintenance system antidote protein VapI
MLMTRRTPTTVGEILTQQFMEPVGLMRRGLTEARAALRANT